MVCRSHSLCWQGRARCQWKGLGRMLPHCSFHPLWPWRALQGQGDLQPSGCAEMAARPLQVAYLDMLVSYNFQAAPGTPLHHQGSPSMHLRGTGWQVLSFWCHPLYQADYHSAVTLFWLPSIRVAHRPEAVVALSEGLHPD